MIIVICAQTGLHVDIIRVNLFYGKFYTCTDSVCKALLSSYEWELGLEATLRHLEETLRDLNYPVK